MVQQTATLSYNPITATYLDPDITLDLPTTNSDGNVSFSLVNDVTSVNVGSITGNILTILNAGSGTLTINISETDNYFAISKSVKLIVNKKTPVLTGFAVSSEPIYADSTNNIITLPTSTPASSGAFSYSLSNSVSVKNNTSLSSVISYTHHYSLPHFFTTNRAGNVNLTITQAATANFTSATATIKVNVVKAPLPSNYGFDSSNFILPYILRTTNPNPLVYAEDSIVIPLNYVDSYIPYVRLIKLTTTSNGVTTIPCYNYLRNDIFGFTYTSSNSNIISVNGSTLKAEGGGSCTITAKLDSEYYYYESIIGSVNITVLKKDIGFYSYIPYTNIVYGPNVATNTPYSQTTRTETIKVPTATNSTLNSSLIWNVTSSDSNVVSVSNKTLTYQNVGTANITLTSVETNVYNSAQFIVPITITQLVITPTITHSQAGRLNGTTPGDYYPRPGNIYNVDLATSTSLGAISYRSSDEGIVTSPEVITLPNNSQKLRFNVLNGSGGGDPINVTIYLDQAGYTINDNVRYASITSRSLFTLACYKNYVTWTTNANWDGNFADKRYGDAPYIPGLPTTNSDGAFTLSDYDSSIINVSSDKTITILKVGRTNIKLTQVVTTNYLAYSQNRSITINKGTPIGSMGSIPDKMVGDLFTPPFTFTQGDLTNITYSVWSPTQAAEIRNNQVYCKSPGLVYIYVTASETTNYNSYSNYGPDYRFTIKTILPTLGSFNIPSKTFPDSDFVIPTPTSNSPGSWSFVSSNPLVAIIKSNKLSLVGSGRTTITATQAASGMYSSTSISCSFDVSKPSPSNPIQATPANISNVLSLINAAPVAGTIATPVAVSLTTNLTNMSTIKPTSSSVTIKASATKSVSIKKTL